MPPLAYFITFHTYGTWLQGRDAGFVDSNHNAPGEPILPAQPPLEDANRRSMSEPPYRLATADARRTVLDAIREVCCHRGWHLHAAHIRTTHVHVVVSGDAAPEKMLNDFKAYATRKLKTSAGEPSRHTWWARHGSTRHLWDEDGVAGAVRYTLQEQGEPMATHRAEEVSGPSEPRP